MSAMPRVAPRIFAFFLSHAALGLPPPLHADGAAPGWNKLVYLIYRLEVTRYCSLADDAVAAGFRAARDALLAQYRFGKNLIDSARREADLLAYREWDNRGLGGFRRWCRVDAALFARQLLRARNAAAMPSPQPGTTP